MLSRRAGSELCEPWSVPRWSHHHPSFPPEVSGDRRLDGESADGHHLCRPPSQRGQVSAVQSPQCLQGGTGASQAFTHLQKSLCPPLPGHTAMWPPREGGASLTSRFQYNVVLQDEDAGAGLTVGRATVPRPGWAVGLGVGDTWLLRPTLWTSSPHG